MWFCIWNLSLSWAFLWRNLQGSPHCIIFTLAIQLSQLLPLPLLMHLGNIVPWMVFLSDASTSMPYSVCLWTGQSTTLSTCLKRFILGPCTPPHQGYGLILHQHAVSILLSSINIYNLNEISSLWSVFLISSEMIPISLFLLLILLTSFSSLNSHRNDSLFSY